MLALARKKLPHIRFYRQNMTSFNIAKQFDAIVCLFIPSITFTFDPSYSQLI
jgi:hypothetical protein